MTTRILHAVDMQFDFMHSAGKLYVKGAEALIVPANDFFKSVGKKAFDFAVFTYDTHFRSEYELSPEKEHFPLHCEYGTKGWNLAVNPALLNGGFPVFYLTKNTFDVWGKNPLSPEVKLDLSHDEQEAYSNLRRLTIDRNALKAGLRLKCIFDALPKGRDVEVTMIGVASDFCVHDAMLGYLQRGATVKVVSDLVKGIGSVVPGRAASGRIEDVLKLPVFAPYVASGKLRLIRSSDAVNDFQPRCA